MLQRTRVRSLPRSIGLARQRKRKEIDYYDENERNFDVYQDGVADRMVLALKEKAGRSHEQDGGSSAEGLRIFGMQGGAAEDLRDPARGGFVVTDGIRGG